MKVDLDSLQKNKKVVELLTSQVIRELFNTKLVDSLGSAWKELITK
ncbi:MAG: hypothetical protein ACKO33_06155 [Bacteroidota bacterium]|nr:hypothetical protein [Bacteroidota bacterium]